MGTEDDKKARVHVQADIEVAGPERRVHAVLKEMSRDSARLTLAEVPAEMGELLELYLPAPGGIIEIMGEIVELGGKAPAHDVAVRFALVEPPEQRKLDELLLLLLAGSGGGQRQAPRIARSMEVVLGGGQRAELVDVARGGVGVIVDGRLELGQNLELALGGVMVRGQVVNQRVVQRQGRRAYHVGVKFDALDAATRRRVDAFIQSLVVHDL